MFKKVMVIAAAAFFLAGCDKHEPYGIVTEQKLENVVRIVMREEGHYGLFVQELGAKTVQEKQLWIKKGHRTFIADVPADKNPWLLIRRDQKNQIWSVEFHIRNAGDLGAGGYVVRSGKSSRFVQPAIIE